MYPPMMQQKVSLRDTFYLLRVIMNITPSKLSLITARFRDPSQTKLTQASLAKHMGKGRAWANKIMNGAISTMSDEDAEKLEEFLGIELDAKYLEKPHSVPPALLKLEVRGQAWAMAFSQRVRFPFAPVTQLRRKSSSYTIPVKKMPRVGLEPTPLAGPDPKAYRWLLPINGLTFLWAVFGAFSVWCGQFLRLARDIIYTGFGGIIKPRLWAFASERCPDQ